MVCFNLFWILDFAGAAKKEGNTNSQDKDKAKKVSNPSVVVENFKQMLVHVKRRLDTQSDEVHA